MERKLKFGASFLLSVVLFVAIETTEPVETCDDVKALKNSTCNLSFILPSIVAQDDSQFNVSIYHDDTPLDAFTINSNKEDMSTLIQTLLSEVQSSDEGIYTINVEYKRQKYIHKIAVSVGMLKCFLRKCFCIAGEIPFFHACHT